MPEAEFGVGHEVVPAGQIRIAWAQPQGLLQIRLRLLELAQIGCSTGARRVESRRIWIDDEPSVTSVNRFVWAGSHGQISALHQIGARIVANEPDGPVSLTEDFRVVIGLRTCPREKVLPSICTSVANERVSIVGVDL